MTPTDPVETAGADTVLVHREGSIHYVTINRPARLNAIDHATHLRLADAVREAGRDPDSRVIVITGSGRAFCAGGDVKGMEGRTQFGAENRPWVHSPGRDLVDTLIRTEKPVISMVNGPAVGLGATIALLGDIVVMSEDAAIGDRHVNVGLVAGDGGAVVWPLLIGPAKAKEFLMTGRMIDGREAERLGLVAHCVPAESLRATVVGIADELAALPPYAVMASKASVNRILQAVSDVVLETSLAYEHLSMHTEDHQEAVHAWMEKRAGTYVGR